mmetsp:Transcript_64799/g.115256  ORF Transcript_64799/g.115256 Transcript_64799/m.115256 type:complete len:80 (-) Transcript_64799:437-676(-)
MTESSFHLILPTWIGYASPLGAVSETYSTPCDLSLLLLVLVGPLWAKNWLRGSAGTTWQHNADIHHKFWTLDRRTFDLG